MRVSEILEGKVKPDYENDTGVQWWFDIENTQYARKRHRTLEVALPDVACWITKHVDGRFERVITQDTDVIWAGTGLEAMAIEIDKLKVIRKFQELSHERTDDDKSRRSKKDQRRDATQVRT